ERFADNSNFNVISLEPIGGLPEVLADFIAKNPRAIPVIGHIFRKSTTILIQKITWVFVHSLGKSFSKKTAKKFPMGYFMIVEKQ
ncbi:MAG: hypothetical protein HKN34_03835, partial [Gammaproteobacteria bacterium]|nr:hypothetical protein [Gammaproteobacteria bacterium]